MNWAWGQALTPTLKLVLMALADAADDQGVCWPSVSTLARKCTVSTRTVQRALRTLVDQNLLIAEPRHRRDGSSTSNRYRLRMGGGDNLSPPHEMAAARAGQACPRVPDGVLVPGTTTRIVRGSPQLGGDQGRRVTSPAVAAGGGPRFPLENPKELSPSERADAQERLCRVPPELAQWLLDELAARLDAGTIRVSPIGYLR
jgi:hypothetical protein